MPDSRTAELEALRRFLASLAKFVLFVIPVYAVLVCAVGLLPGVVRKDDDSKAYLILRELPRNINYELGLYGYMFTRAREARHTRNIDVLFVGSSYTYRGFDPRLFAEVGLTSFNLGSSAQTHIQTRVLLRRYLKQMNPKVVIYEVSPSLFGSDGMESAFDMIANDRNDLETVWMALRINSLVVYHTLIYGFFRDLFDLNADYREDIHIGMDTYVPGGYVERQLAHFAGRKGKRRGRLSKMTAYPDQISAFKKNVEFIRANGIRPVLVRAPWTRFRYERQPDRESFDDIMRAQAEYYDFNQLMELDDTRHFYDAMHLNQLGVELFNRELIRLLFPEHHY